MSSSAGSRPRSGRWNKVFNTAIALIPVGVVGNVVLSYLTTDRTLLQSVARFPREYLLLALLLAFLPWLTNTLRLLIWARFLGSDLRLVDSFRITLGTQLGSAVTPTATGGEIIRIGFLVQRGISPGIAFTISTLASLEDGLFFLLSIPAALLVFSASGMPVLPGFGAHAPARIASVLLVAAAIAAVTWGVVQLALSGRLGERVRTVGLRWTGWLRRRVRTGWEETRGAFRMIWARGKSRFALTFSLTAVQWMARYSVITALAAFLGAEVDPFLFFALQWVVFAMMSLVPTPGAAGGAEAAFFLVFASVLPRNVIGLATAGWRFLTFYLQLGIGAVLFTLLNTADRRRRRLAGSGGNPARQLRDDRSAAGA